MIRRRSYSALVLAIWALGLGICAASVAGQARPVVQAQEPQLPYPWKTVTPDRPAAGDWATYRRTFDVTAFSPLRQIARNNVSQLRSVWSYSVPDTATWALTPIAANGIMYIVEGGNRVTALDAATGDVLWVHERTYPEDIAMSQALNRSRGLTMSGDTIYWGTPDAFLLAIDARTGKTRWETRTGDYHTGEGHNHPGLVADGKVFIGHSGGDRTTRGKFRAFDEKTGALLWTVNTVPQVGQPGSETWGPNFPPLGAAPWATVSYDPALKVVYFATGQPGPWSSSSRGEGSALYSNSIMAVDADSGKLRWYFQVLPSEDWDRDVVFEVMLVDLTIAGKARKALIQTGKPGWGVVLDRDTGEFLHAFQVAHETVITGWTKEGRPIIDESLSPKPEDLGTDKVFQICPSLMGARNLNAASFSPETKLYYAGINHTCLNGRAGAPVQYTLGRNLTGGNGPTVMVPGKDYVGELTAFDPATGDRKWGYKAANGAAMSGGVLSTAGGLVFSGTVDRELFAVDDRNGNLLWKTRLNGDISGSPITFEVDGRQYVAVTAGGRTIANNALALLTNVRIPQGSGAVWVFALPDDRDLQPVSRISARPVMVSTSGVQAGRGGGRAGGGRGGGALQAGSVAPVSSQGLFTVAQATRGEAVYREKCLACHSVQNMTGAAFRAKWANAVLGELFSLVSNTMPQNAPASLSKEDSAAVVAYLLGSSGYPAGPTELPGDLASLVSVRIPR